MKRTPWLLLIPAGAALFLGAAAYDDVDDAYLHRDRGGNLERSVALLRERLSRSPDDPQALWRMARSLAAMGDRAAGVKEKDTLFLRAEEAAERAVQQDPKEAQAYYWKGMAMGLRGEAHGMFRSIWLVRPLKRTMRRVIELDPRHAGAHHFLGEMYRQLPSFAGGSKRQAVRELETAVELAPGCVGAYVDLARAYLDLDDREAARKTLTRGLEVWTPEDPAEYDDALAQARKLLADLR